MENIILGCGSTSRWTRWYACKDGSHHSCKSAEARGNGICLLYAVVCKGIYHCCLLEQWGGRAMERVTWCVHLQLPQAWLGCRGIRSLLSKAWPSVFGRGSQLHWTVSVSTVSLLFSMPLYNIVGPQLQTPMSNTHTYTFLLSSHTTLGGPLHQDRTDKTVVKTSLKPCSCSITEGSEMLIVLCIWTCFHTVSCHDFVYCPSAAFHRQ